MPTEASLRDALFHFSEDPAIRVFEPRAVRVPAERAAGMAWLNGPLVWAIAAPFQALYLFPRDCPRIVILRKPKSSEADLARWFGSSNSVAVAYVEQDWMDRIAATPLYRYDLPPASFQDLDDAGMHVARTAVTPRGMDTLLCPLDALHDARVDVRMLPRLTPLRDLWSTTLHVSGIRLRNALGW